jgi:putative effector of murein hydrolase LrgA (UPF0299 family)
MASCCRNSRLCRFEALLRQLERSVVPAVVSVTRVLLAGVREIVKEFAVTVLSVIGLWTVIAWMLSRALR